MSKETNEEILTDLKLLKGIDDNDTIQDRLLNLLIRQSKKAILSKVNEFRIEPMQSVPPDLDWIVLEVSSKRFNRVGSEGTKKHTREGETFDWGSLLDGYDGEFMKYAQEEETNQPKKGVLRIW